MFPFQISTASSTGSGWTIALLSLSILFDSHLASAQCAYYGQYAKESHEPFSLGIYHLSYARPAEDCRTFKSTELEEELRRLKGVIADPDLYRLFENAWPSTLDTTVKWRGYATAKAPASDIEDSGLKDKRTVVISDDEGVDKPEDEDETIKPHESKESEELAFIITGDIEAMWLRDSANQLQAYVPILKPSTEPNSIASLFRGAINLQARSILIAPFCNAFQPPPESNLTRTRFVNSDQISPEFDRMSVSSCQWELDSLASFLQLSHDYYKATADHEFFQKWQWKEAVEKILDTTDSMMGDSYEENGDWKHTPYTYCAPYGGTPINDCNGSPHRGNIGLVRSFHRPSDDACTYQYLVPSNMMYAVALERAAKIMGTLDEVNQNLVDRMTQTAKNIREGIARHAHISHPTYGTIFPYELDGYGSVNIMDDANIPSLLSTPFLGFADQSDAIYQNTRRLLLSKDNPYYAWGSLISGIGSPHTLPGRPWPMSLIMQIMTSDVDNEIVRCLKMLLRSTDGTGLIHESQKASMRRSSGVSPSHGGWTREWFSWANGLFGQMILDLEKRKPHLLELSYQGDE